MSSTREPEDVFIVADEEMPNACDSEFMLGSDGDSPLPCLHTEYDCADELQTFDSIRTTEPKALLSPTHNLTVPPTAANTRSPNGGYDSASDSSSARLPPSLSSSRSMLTEDGSMKDDEKRSSEFATFMDRAVNEVYFGSGDGTIDPSRIEKHFSFKTSNSPEPAGVADTPSTFDNTDAGDFSPRMNDIDKWNDGGNTISPFSRHEARRRSQAHARRSLTQTMDRLTTEGSREVTPLYTGSSPSPMIDSSSSPTLAFGFSRKALWDGQPGRSVWPELMAQQRGLDPASSRMQTALQAAPSAGIGFPTPDPYNTSPYRLEVHNTPAKSRVETQLNTKLTLSPAPQGITGLHLQVHTISRVKYLIKPPPQPQRNVLELHTTLVCTSAMQHPARMEDACRRARAVAQGLPVEEDQKPQDGGGVRICDNCMGRERKRASRKKVKKPDDEKLWTQNESRRVIVFNLHENQEWRPKSDGLGLELELPMRIACYCRHHQEKAGFRVIITLTDYLSNFVAQAMSDSIMITDDHKTHAPPQMAGSSVNGPDTSLMPVTRNPPPQDLSSLTPPGAAFHSSQSSSNLQMGGRNSLATFPPPGVPTGPSQPTVAATMPRNLSRSASPTGASGPYSKKRKASGPAKIPSGLAMTRLDNPHPPLAQQPSRPLGPSQSTATSPFSPNQSSFSPATEAMFGCTPLNTPAASQLFPVGSPTPNGNDQAMSTSIDNLFAPQAQLYSAPPSSHPSRAPSPNGLRVNHSMLQHQQQQQQQQQNAQVAHVLANTAQYSSAMNSNLPRPYVIHKIIPAEGPKSGGVEVTILGSGFRQGSEVIFGSTRATTTTFWSDNSLVCLLPPAAQAGLVIVTLESLDMSQLQGKCPTFKYIDDDEQQLMRTALTVLGQKLTGDVEDVGDIARRIIGDNSSWTSSTSNGHSGHGHSAGGSSYTKFEMSLEAKLLKVLELIDLDDSTHKPRLNLRRSTGQTMLHLACSIGLHRFAAGLLARGANPDVRDVGGYTALHVASLNNHPEIVRRLISYGADPTIRTLSGLTPADVALSPDVVEAIRLVEKHARSYSSGSIHSRASSMTSLKSLWGPASATQPALGQTQTDESETSEESPEYSSEDLSSEQDPDIVDDGPWLNMRRRSMVGPLPHDDGSNPLLQPPRPGVPGGLGSPTAAVTVLKEHVTTQLQQLQQVMAMHLQNLPQFSRPQMPHMPHMPPLADYHALLAAMVPNIGVPRPGGRDMDYKWWDISSLMPSPTPPPAYEEIFPQGDMDKKQASAAQAAAEAEADHKCATLYDQPSKSAQSVERMISVVPPPEARHHKLPELLQLGRKNSITEEQRENLRRAHAEKLKRLSRDRNLFFIWIPLLVITSCAMLYSRFPGLFATVRAFTPIFRSRDLSDVAYPVAEVM